jgi:hypothetical protein
MSRKPNNIDERWAEGKADAQVTGKRTRKPKKFDDDEPSTEQPGAKKSKASKETTKSKSTSKPSKSKKSRANKSNTNPEASTVSTLPKLPPIKDSNTSDTLCSAIDYGLDSSTSPCPNECIDTNPPTWTLGPNRPISVCATTAPQAEIAKKPKTKEPKVKKVDAKEWCQEIKDHPDVNKNWVVLSAEGFEVICNICPGSKPHKLKRRFELGNWIAHEKTPSHESYRASKILTEQRVAAGLEK